MMGVIFKPCLGKPQTMQFPFSFIFLAESYGGNQQSEHGNHMYKNTEIIGMSCRIIPGAKPLPACLKWPFIVTE